MGMWCSRGSRAVTACFCDGSGADLQLVTTQKTYLGEDERTSVKESRFCAKEELAMWVIDAEKHQRDQIQQGNSGSL
eukprot:182956-Rhodomonas_salina.2